MSEPTRKLSRRTTLFAGAGAIGAVAAGAAFLPHVAEPQSQAASTQKKEPPAKGGGYHVTDHVERYYKSTRI